MACCTIETNNHVLRLQEQLEYNNVFSNEQVTPETIPEPEKKSHSQMDSITSHAVHRKPGTLVPSEDEIQNHHFDDMVPPTRYETKTTPKSVSRTGFSVGFSILSLHK